MAFRGSSAFLTISFPRYLTYPASTHPKLRTAFPRYHPALRYRMHGTQKEAKVIKKTTLEEEDILSKNWKIKMLYDGECPLCMREVNMLKKRNEQCGAIKFVDISSREYSPEENQGLDYETVMGRIHGILSDGTVVTDIEAFRRLYEEVGLGWIYAITKYKPVATIVNAIYGVWAKYRLQITGRPPLEDVLEARRKNKVSSSYVSLNLEFSNKWLERSPGGGKSTLPVAGVLGIGADGWNLPVASLRGWPLLRHS